MCFVSGLAPNSFSDNPSTKYGDELREQVEERLKFYDTGEAPRKNISVMEKVAKEIAEEGNDEAKVATPSKKKKKRRKEADDSTDGVKEAPSSKKKKKKKSSA